MFSNCRNVHGGGVAMYVSNVYASSVVNHLTILHPFIETIGVETLVKTKKYLFLCIYRPPSGDIDSFLMTMTDILTSVHETKYQGIYIFGDFNLNLLKYNEKNVIAFINLMFTFSLYPLIAKPTRVSSTSATLIDHIWATQLEDNIGNYIIETDISDHFPTVSQFKLVQANQEPECVYKRSVTAFSLEEFTNDLALVDWSDVTNLNCCNEAYELFYTIFYNNFQKHFPIKKFRFNRKTEISPYITPALKNSINEKHRLERLSKKWPLTYEQTFKKYRNKLTSILRSAKNLYFKSKLSDNQGNPKSQWKTINSLLGRSSSAHKHNIELNPLCMDASVTFNEHF